MTGKRALLPALFLSAAAVLLAGCGGPNLFDHVRVFGSSGICWTIVVVLDIIALIEVAGSSRSTGDKLVWALIILFFPLFGCIVYYLFARK
jgi:Phospholipase_D-nuclease N-terminal